MPPSDPWDDEAAKFKPSGGAPASTSTPQQDEDDYSVWNKTKGGDSSDPKQGWRDRFMAATSDPALTPHPQGTARGSVERVVQGGMEGLSGSVLHPLDTLGSMAEATPAGAVFDLATGRKNASQQQAEDLVNGMRKDPATTLGQVGGGAVAGAMLPGAIAEGVNAGRGAVSAFKNFRPTSAPNIVPPAEAAARELTNAVAPDLRRAPAYIKAAQVEVPNVLDYAKRTNNPLRTQLEFSKAAEGNAQEARGHYEDNVLGPNADHKVPVPAGSQVQSIPAGENTQNRVTTLRNVDKRIVDINKELDKPRLNPTDTRSALAPEAELIAEKAQLTDILHRSLSDLTGIAPEDVADLRQRVGRSRELANDTNAAVTKRGLSDARPGELPVHKAGIATKAVNTLRGGEQAIADRAFQSAIKNFPGEAKPLPQVTGPKAVPAPASADVFSKLQNVEQQRAPANVSPINSGPTPNVGDVQPPPRPLVRAAAQDIYNRAGKDPVKARELAKKEGYTW